MSGVLVSPASLAYAVLCTDYPELEEPKIDALLSELSVDDFASFPLCPALLSGVAHGAGRSAAARAASESSVPGLVASSASPSRYASVYAIGCVLRACSLLTRCADREFLSAALTSYELPVNPSVQGVHEVIVPEGEAAVDGEEVWATELDDDDDAYEPISASPQDAADADGRCSGGAQATGERWSW